MKFTPEQIANVIAFEKVRQSGEFNMFDPRAAIASGLRYSEYTFVMENYFELATAAKILN